jgi:phage tail sheath gpL-like
MITVAGVPVSTFAPGVYLNVILGGSGSSAGLALTKILLLGNLIAANITGATPAFTVTAGTAAVAQVVQCASPSDADTLGGAGGELTRMSYRVFEMFPNAAVYWCPVAESAGTAASATLTFATNGTGSSTLRLYLAGQVIDVALNGTTSSPITPTAFATSVATAVNAVTSLPMTAQFAAGVVTFTAKHKGPRGNWLQCRAQWMNGPSIVEVIASASSSGAGMTAAFGDATKKLSLGATVDSNTNALAAILSVKFDRIVSAANDATQLTSLVSQVNTQAGATTQFRQQIICATADTLGNATTLAADPTTGQNAPRLQIVWQKNAQNPPEEIAAQVCAARVNGDSLVTSDNPADGEASDPACNLDGTLLKKIKSQFDPTDLPSASDYESALHNGLTPLQPTFGGLTMIKRSITSRSLDSNKQANYAVLDTTYVTVADYVANDLQSDLYNTYRHYKLESDNAAGTAPKGAKIVTPSQIRDRIAYKLQFYQNELHIIRNVEAHLDQLAVVENVLVPGRVDMEIPEECIPGLHILAGNVRSVLNT